MPVSSNQPSEQDDETGGQLDWSLFDDVERLAFVQSLDDVLLASSDSLDRVSRVAAQASGSRFAQISLIGEHQFVPAAHGLTYTADRQHTPIADSLCSVTMASGGVLRIENTARHAWTKDLPPVVEGGVAAYLGVPLCDPAGRPVGALCVFHPQPRHWTDNDISVLVDLAQLVTREIHLLSALESAAKSELLLRRAISDLIDRPRLGKGSAIHARAQYVFAAGAPAGGDWIDWIELDDRVAFSVGDVAGHGVESIVVMEELRHSLRAYATESVVPGEAILKASQLLRQVRPHDVATAIKGDFNPATGLTRFAVAGHPAPIHLSGGRAQLVPVRPGPPLGVLTSAPPMCEVVLEEGDRLLIYTDGVFERRGEPLDEGFARVVSAMERYAHLDDIDLASKAILDDALAGEINDDACLLLIERPHSRTH